tara:strand:+ start:143 stop:427 length:285 start_codon:yes stop_codon:yes gene_type:complete
MMKKFFFPLVLIAGLSSCSLLPEDRTCTCTVSSYTYAGVTVPGYTESTECLECDSDEIAAFEETCTAEDDILQALAESYEALGYEGFSASCSID